MKQTAVIVPYKDLSSQALQGLIEEFVTRDGTDYGEVEVSVKQKISQILNLLESGKAVVVFDQATQTCNILKSNNPAVKNLEK